jgi:hypothetical protein
MRILEIGLTPFLSSHVPTLSDFYSTEKAAPTERRLSLSNILKLRRRLMAGSYDLVVFHTASKVLAPWHRSPSRLGGIFNALFSVLFSFHKASLHLFFYSLKPLNTPLVIIDNQDTAHINRTELKWLDRARFFFMRELPPNRLNLFLNMDSRCGNVVNVGRRVEISRNLSKIEPFSLGFSLQGMINLAGSDKIYDVFYAGKNHTTTVRQHGNEELQAMKDAGLRVFIPEKPLPREDFLKACAQSWLVWSPEGQGWNCYRHFEALMMGSVPLINYPTIECLQPLENRKHCLYYRPERGGLTDAVQSALRNHDLLLKIAEEGRAHVLQHHTWKQLARHVLQKTGLLAQAEAFLVEA